MIHQIKDNFIFLHIKKRPVNVVNDGEMTAPPLPSYEPERRLRVITHQFGKETTLKVIKTNYFDNRFVGKQMGNDQIIYTNFK